MNILIHIDNYYDIYLDNYYSSNKYKFTIMFLNISEFKQQQTFRIKIYKENQIFLGSIIVNNFITKTVFHYLINCKFINIINKSIIECNETFYTFKLTEKFINTYTNQLIKLL